MMKKKFWNSIAAVAAVCITASAAISAYGYSVNGTTGLNGAADVVDEQAPGSVRNADEDEGDVTVIDTAMAGCFVNEAQGDGYRISEDGTFTSYADFEEKKGKTIGIVIPKDGEWIFSSPVFDQGSLTATFTDSKWVIGGKTYTETFNYVSGVSIHFRGIYADGKSSLIWCRQMKNLEKEGFTCSEDLTRMMKPQEISGDIKVTVKKAEATVRAINPYENSAPLSDCLICSFYTEDTKGIFRFESDGAYCGQDCFDKLLEKDVYVYEKDRLVYKEYLMVFHDFDYKAGDDSRGEKVLNPTGECDLTFCFDGSRLKSFCYTSPALLYSGLDSNVDASALGGMDEKEIEGALKVRGDIRDELIEAYKQAGMEVEIDETTGEIAMDSTVLFAVNSYTLSEEGKEYLDRFMKVYLQVLFSEKFKEYIDHVDFEGHTDSEGSYGYNMDLSLNRANAVLNYCLESDANGLTEEQKQMLREKAVTEGFSSSDLVYDENGKEDRDASRRVAVKFFIRVN